MAGFDAHKNLAVSAVVTAPTPATSGTSLSVTAGEGVRFPAAPFNATVWPANAMPTPLNGEVIRVTARATDTLTITRAQEGTTARAIGSGDLIAATVTAKTLTDLETRAALKDEQNTFTADQHLEGSGAIRLGFKDVAQPVDARLFRWGASVEMGLFALNDAATVVQATPITARRTGDVAIGRDLFEKARVTPLGHWIDVAFSAGNFTANPSGTFVVSGHYAEAYTLVGRTMNYTFYFNTSVTGTPTSLRIALPPGVTARINTGGLFMYGSAIGFVKVVPGGTFLSLFRDVTETPTWVAGAHLMAGSLSFGIN